MRSATQLMRSQYRRLSSSRPGRRSCSPRRLRVQLSTSVSDVLRPPVRGESRSLCDALDMPELAGRLYVPKLYNLDGDRALVVDFLASAVEASGGRVVYNSFADDRAGAHLHGSRGWRRPSIRDAHVPVHGDEACHEESPA